MSAVPSLERLLRREGILTIASLFALWALTWAYLATGAGLGMPPLEMTRLAFFPPAGAISAPAMAMPWQSMHWALMVAMWWTMMIAMMTPSAAPTILLYARVHRHTQTQEPPAATPAPTGAFAAGYFLIWLVFSIAATALHKTLEDAGVIAPMTMSSQIPWLSGGVLIATGLYQLSPWKNACLSHCRAPAQFLSRHWRPGAFGALWLGALHGAYCVGCCWLLMALLFVGGVMNLAWIAMLSLLVLAEKVVAAGRWVGYGAGIVLVAWGAAIWLR